MHGLHEDTRVSYVPARRWPNGERHEGMHCRVTQLAQLLVLEPIEKAKISVGCPRNDEGSSAIRGAETIRVGLRVPNGTLAIPPEQGADAAPQPEERLGYHRRRLAPRGHHRPHVLDGTAGAATRQPNRPRILHWDVVQQFVRAKGSRAKFSWVDTHRHAHPSRGQRSIQRPKVRGRVMGQIGVDLPAAWSRSAFAARSSRSISL